MATPEESKLAAVSNVDVDESGRFKYVLIKCYIGESTKCVVRGYSWAEYHGMFILVYLLSPGWTAVSYLYLQFSNSTVRLESSRSYINIYFLNNMF